MARIHPAIGIARLGNSPRGYFIGPELPGVFDYPEGGFRDARNNLKRQGARFRIFGYDDHDQVVGEITEADATIEWLVHVKNTKAVGRKFAGVLHPDVEQRNSEWLRRGNDESKLILDPRRKTVSKREPMKRLLCRSFMGLRFERPLELGRLLYEQDTGRLIVLGGRGISGTPDPRKANLDKEVQAETVGRSDEDISFANHDAWFDDSSDGVVTATVALKSGRRISVKDSWVIAGPPKFAPELQNIVTLYDTLYQVAVDRGLAPDPFADPRFLPSFNRDIYPILRRAHEIRWVFADSKIGHTFSVGPGTPEERVHIFRQFRIPSGHPKEPGTGSGRMPFVWSDLFHEPAVNGTLTRLQYKMMTAWADGIFENDWSGAPPPVSYQISPSGLDRAALEACVGAAFYPGIEASWKMRDVFTYVEPFRLDSESLTPGDITQQMSLPWQSDFVDCAYEDPYVWWPAQRPINVRKDPQKDTYVSWSRSFDDDETEMGYVEMVKNFHRLGHILRLSEGFFETGRVETIAGAKPKKPVKRKKNAKSKKRAKPIHVKLFVPCEP
jgi:L-Lysine epsilon oxidase N-terminal/L-lysine epsilon oxidase C-terminal domain